MVAYSYALNIYNNLSKTSGKSLNVFSKGRNALKMLKSSNPIYSLLGNNVPSVVVCLINNRFDYRVKQIALECHSLPSWWM